MDGTLALLKKLIDRAAEHLPGHPSVQVVLRTPQLHLVVQKDFVMKKMECIFVATTFAGQVLNGRIMNLE